MGATLTFCPTLTGCIKAVTSRISTIQVNLN